MIVENAQMSARRFTAFSSPRLMQSSSMAEKRGGERGPPFPLVRDYDNCHPRVTSPRFSACLLVRVSAAGDRIC